MRPKAKKEDPDQDQDQDQQHNLSTAAAPGPTTTTAIHVPKNKDFVACAKSGQGYISFEEGLEWKFVSKHFFNIYIIKLNIKIY